MESKHKMILIQQVHELELENQQLRQTIKNLQYEINITEYFNNRYPNYTNKL